MAGAEIKKFLFDDDFAVHEDAILAPEKEEPGKDEADALVANGLEPDAIDGEIEEPVEEAPPTFSEEDLDIARREGEQTGRDEALKDLEGSLQKKLADTLQALLQQFTTIETAFADDKEERNLNAVGVATVIVRKLFPALNMDKAIDEIDHMIHQAMKRTAGEIKLNFFVAEELASEVEGKLKEQIQGSGRNIEYQVIGKADMAPGDCRIEWDGGGLVRDQALMWQEIDEIIESNLGEIPQEQAQEQTQEPTPQQAQEQAQEPTQEQAQEPAQEDGADDGADNGATETQTP